MQTDSVSLKGIFEGVFENGAEEDIWTKER
jgi:hypothetical protein